MEEDTSLRVTISILTFNRCEILRELLASLNNLTYSPLEVIVIDNHSTDGTEEMMKHDFPQFYHLRMQENKGVEARNYGLRVATGNIVITLDDDVLGITDTHITSLTRIFNEHQEVGAVCFKVLDYWSGTICNWCHHYIKEDYSKKTFITDEISEGAVAFRRKVFEKSGYYPSTFFISYEGTDLSCRMLDVGYKTIFCPEIVVRHKHAQQGRPGWRRYYYDTRNQIWFVVRNYPITWGIRYLARGLGAMLLYSVRDGFFRYWIKGVWDGVKAFPAVAKERKLLGDKALATLREIGTHRPGMIYMLKNRIFQRGVRI